ncbi:MAG: hypothetical protein N3A61_08565, partial [Ignavibacteria bacterium]|nr:hypothetical protein [Ignavibacteria bacterium]
SKLFLAQEYDELNKLRLAQSYEAIGNFEKALELYKELYFKKPNDFNYYDGYLRGLLQLKRYDESIALIKSRIKIIPNDISLYAQLAVIYDRKEKPDSVSYFINTAISIDPKNLMTYKIISNVLMENRLFENAIDVLEAGKGKVENSSSLSIDLANLYSLLMNYRKASEELLNLVILDGNNYSFAQTKLSTFITKPDAIETAINVFESYKKKAENINVLRLLSWLYLQAKQYEKAFNLTVEIDEKVKSNGFEILSFADRAYREKAIEVAVEAYNYLLKNYPNQKDIRAFSIIGLARSNEEVFILTQKKKQESWKRFTSHLAIEDKSADDVINYYNIIIRDFNNPTLTCESLYKISKIRYEYY